MPTSVPATPPNPKIAAMIAMTKKVNAHPNLLLTPFLSASNYRKG